MMSTQVISVRLCGKKSKTLTARPPTHQTYSGVWYMMFNATFNNISVISWQSVLLVEEPRVPGENHWPVASHLQTLSHNVISSKPRHENG